MRSSHNIYTNGATTLMRISKHTTILFAILFAAIANQSVSATELPKTTIRLEAPPAITTIDDNAPGWVWDGMNDYPDTRLIGGSAHAGGPGSSGDYTFQGSTVHVLVMRGTVITIDGARHRLGKLRISIDGTVKDTVDTTAVDDQYQSVIYSAAGLGPGNHVLTVQSVGGWTVVDAIEVGGAQDIPTTVAVDPSSVDLPGQKPVLFDPLNDFTMVARRSLNWDLDRTNVQFVGNDPSRAVRKVDDEEFLTYHHPKLTAFVLRIYEHSNVPITSLVKLYRSSNDGATIEPIDYRFIGRSAAPVGGWTAYDLGPKQPMPIDTNSLIIVFEPLSNNPWDPNLGQVTLTSPE